MFGDEAREGQEDWYDIMQVCADGHQITAFLKSQPDSGRKFCEACGAVTLSSCPMCKHPIRGYRHIAGVFSTTGVIVPNRCGSCGAEYPWSVSRNAKDFVGLVSGFGKFIRSDSTLSVWRMAMDTYARIGVAPLAAPNDLLASLDQFYWVVAGGVEVAGVLNDAKLTAHMKWFTTFLRQFENGLKHFLLLLGYAEKASIAKDYSAFAVSFNEWVRNYEQFLANLRQPHNFLRAPALADIGSKATPPKGGEKVYAAGEAFDLYKDLRELFTKASKNVFIVEPFPGEETFELYLEKVPTGIPIRLLVKSWKAGVEFVSKKFLAKPGMKAEIRKSDAIHDRMFFIDGRCWACGRSPKDAGFKDPTYLVELTDTASQLLKLYEDSWNAAKPI